MNPRWEESEFVFCDLQTAARRIHHDNPQAARAFLEAAYDTFEYLARNPGLGRARGDLGFPEVRSWRIAGFRRYLVSTASYRIVFKSGACCTAHAIFTTRFPSSP